MKGAKKIENLYSVHVNQNTLYFLFPGPGPSNMDGQRVFKRSLRGFLGAVEETNTKGHDRNKEISQRKSIS